MKPLSHDSLLEVLKRVSKKHPTQKLINVVERVTAAASESAQQTEVPRFNNDRA